jgi:alkylated DNA repair dioxygenase AlkB
MFLLAMSFTSNPEPLVLATSCARLVGAGLLPEEPDQITVNEYAPGVGIRPHVDTHSAFGEGIASADFEANNNVQKASF